MKLKSSVNPFGLKPEMIFPIIVCNEVYADYGIDCVITSISDSKHGQYSRHYLGYAIDVRTRNVPPDKLNYLFREIKFKLNDRYNCILEKDHIHISFKPKFEESFG